MSKIPADFQINGIIAAPATALHPNGDVNTEAIKDYVEFFANNNIDGVFILGTLGEGMSLSVSERKEVAAAWVKYSRDRLSSVIVHVGAGNIRDSIELARHAQEIQATAVACMAPNYFKPPNEAALVEYMEQVAAAAPETPFYYYCINFMTGVYLDTSEFLRLADNRIPNLRGIKMSSRELPSLLDSSLVCGGKFNIMIGSDEQLLTSLVLGVRTPVINGYIGNIVRRLQEAFDKGDLETARQEQILIRNLSRVNQKYGSGPATVKAVMKCLGVNLGPVRLPLKDLSTERVAELQKDLSKYDLAIK